MSTTTKGTARREHILRQARQILVEDGVDGFVLRRVADRVGIALGNLQYYFPTRAALLDAVVRDEFEHDRAVIERARDLGGDAVEVLPAIVDALLRRWSGPSHSIYLGAGAIALHDESLASTIRQVWLAFHDAIADVVGAIDPAADSDDIRARAVAITALLDGATLQPIGALDLDAVTFTEHIRSAALAIARPGR